MNERDRDATLRYLDFTLKNYIEAFKGHVDEDVYQVMCEQGHALLVDLSMTINTQMLMEKQAVLNDIRKKLR